MQIAVTVCMVLLCIFSSSCRVTRHVPKDKDVVSKVRIVVDDQASSNNSLKMAVQQKAYHRTFGFLPIAAWIWHNDTTRNFTRWRNKMGSEPLAYDPDKALATERSMALSLISQGYLRPEVSHEVNTKNRKATVTYIINRGIPKHINSVRFFVEDPDIEGLINETSSDCHMTKGGLLDRNTLEDERTRITTLLRNHGFWDFNKDNISFIADTLKGRPEVDLTVTLSGLHEKFHFNKVHFVTNYNIMSNASSANTVITDLGEGYYLQTEGAESYLRTSTLINHCNIIPGQQYTESAVNDTYTSYSRLHILKYTNIRIEAVDVNKLDAYIYLAEQNPKSIQFELDGTNTAGDLGVAGAFTYQHRNIFHGSETYSLT